MKASYALLLAIVALPAASALPALCGTDCRINASSLPGYDPVLAVIASGSTVTFHSVDVQHFTRDLSVTGAGAPECFFADHPGGEDSSPVLFEIADGGLQATIDGVTTTCTSAAGAGAGGFVLNYFCVLHPFMRAALVVTN